MAFVLGMQPPRLSEAAARRTKLALHIRSNISEFAPSFAFRQLPTDTNRKAFRFTASDMAAQESRQRR
jgi:hypothetical protein